MALHVIVLLDGLVTRVKPTSTSVNPIPVYMAQHATILTAVSRGIVLMDGLETSVKPTSTSVNLILVNIEAPVSM
ncbi:hypothetical protein KP79_PYT12017 [Mizuhopecten yessoensis]|uniref:Uncharacterized protein n=1 Tax=Mizuhopecten yessoensis TaxID=6573 RepID=A0A210R5B6_MIZYE|nr:hypothetical protein KP79_PYT12017 [Mizuhopecten yessoensis]